MMSIYASGGVHTSVESIMSTYAVSVYLCVYCSTVDCVKYWKYCQGIGSITVLVYVVYVFFIYRWFLTLSMLCVEKKRNVGESILKWYDKHIPI